jgi:hypothetical protein
MFAAVTRRAMRGWIPRGYMLSRLVNFLTATAVGRPARERI